MAYDVYITVTENVESVAITVTPATNDVAITATQTTEDVTLNVHGVINYPEIEEEVIAYAIVL